MLMVLVFSVIAVGIGKSLQHLWRILMSKRYFFSFSNLLLLISVYGTVLLGFGLLYVSLECMNVPILHEHGLPLSTNSFHLVEVCLYFSTITLLSVGYGDIIPIGIGRWIAMIEALLGYVMPAAFIFHSIIENEKR